MATSGFARAKDLPGDAGAKPSYADITVRVADAPTRGESN